MKLTCVKLNDPIILVPLATGLIIALSSWLYIPYQDREIYDFEYSGLAFRLKLEPPEIQKLAAEKMADGKITNRELQEIKDTTGRAELRATLRNLEIPVEGVHDDNVSGRAAGTDYRGRPAELEKRNRSAD